MEKYCLTCANYRPKETKADGWVETLPGFKEPNYVEVPRHCEKCNEVMTAWFEKYGNMTSKSLPKEAELSCYEPPEDLLLLDACIEKAKEVLEIIEKNKD